MSTDKCCRREPCPLDAIPGSEYCDIHSPAPTVEKVPDLVPQTGTMPLGSGPSGRFENVTEVRINGGADLVPKAEPVTGPRPLNKQVPEETVSDEIRLGKRKLCGHIAECDCQNGIFMPAEPQARELQAANDGMEPVTETRWQNAIYEKCKKAVGPENDYLIDGGGCDSGDALDVSLAEIGQAIGFWQDEAASLRERNEELERREKDIANLLCNVAQILDVAKQEWGDAWSAWDQQQRDQITLILKELYDGERTGGRTS